MITRDKLLSWFIRNEYDLYQSMESTTHYKYPDQPHPFHEEGSIWTHTLMVMTWIEALYRTHLDYIPLITTALLHDVGKPDSIKVTPATSTKPERNSFHGHAGLSTFKSVSILRKLQQEFPTVYTEEQIKLILKLVSLHDVAIDTLDNKLYQLLTIFRRADRAGAVRNVDEDIYGGSQKRKYAPQVPKDPDKQVVFLIGLPCSGKSTYVNEHYSDWYILSRDTSLADWYHANISEEPATYRTIYDTIHNNPDNLQQFNSYFDSITHLATKKPKVVVDMVNLTLKSRRYKLQQFSDHTATAVVLMSDLNTLEARNRIRSADGKDIPNDVMYMMQTQFVFPVDVEGFNQINFILN